MRLKLNYGDLRVFVSYKLRRRGNRSLVFIHGLGCTKEIFNRVWHFPGFDEFTILTIDLVGFGDSSKPQEFSYDIKDQAEIVKCVLEKLKLENVNLIGHSMGGAVALFLIGKISPKVQSFANLEGNLIREDCTISEKALHLPLNKLKYKMMEVSDAWYKMAMKSSESSFYKSSKSLVSISKSNMLLKRFISLNIRKAYFYGERNANLPVLRKLKNVEKICISKSGHFMMLDNPEEFYSKLLDFIKR